MGEVKLPLLFATLTIRHTSTIFMSAEFSSKQGSSAFDIKSRRFTDFWLCQRVCARAASPHVHVHLGGGNGADRRNRRRRLFVCAGACMRAICCIPADFCSSPVDSSQQWANLSGTELPVKRTHTHKTHGYITATWKNPGNCLRSLSLYNGTVSRLQAPLSSASVYYLSAPSCRMAFGE